MQRSKLLHLIHAATNSLTACPAGQWGADCVKLCNCKTPDTECDPTEGCRECPSGFEGGDCSNDTNECDLVRVALIANVSTHRAHSGVTAMKDTPKPTPPRARISTTAVAARARMERLVSTAATVTVARVSQDYTGTACETETSTPTTTPAVTPTTPAVTTTTPAVTTTTPVIPFVDQARVNVSIKLTSEDFTPDLKNKTSKAYQSLKAKVVQTTPLAMPQYVLYPFSHKLYPSPRKTNNNVFSFA
ncbi:hypothetical protein NP493_1707g00014 [Ridgeia piscesae]|uniref:Uncharacterized protein n=1 Tax=Ridgeia piscesae TaxID=27915 RepID=A0AAD9N8Q3_RIDPI|nr:hypothetical protein NP493_1707g00014 [Ridgeia piscesae]